MKRRIRYEAKVQTEADGCSGREIVVEASDINIGLIAAAVEAVTTLGPAEEIVSVTFWAVES